MFETSSTRLHYKIVAYASGMCAILVCLIVGTSVVQGVGYQDFESILRHRDMALYNQKLVEALPVLRVIYPLDTLYIFGYLTMVFAMVQIAKNLRTLSILAMATVLVLATLDFIENNHIIAMANSADLGHQIQIEQVTLQTIVTQTKFNFGLLLTLMISFLIPSETFPGKVGVWLARLVVLCAPVALLTPTTTLAYVAMNIALGLTIAFVYGKLGYPRAASGQQRFS